MTKNRKLASASRLLIILAPLFAFNTIFAEWKLLQNSPTTNDLHSVFFIDDNTGWIAGDNSTIYKTTNSGESWVKQTSPEACNFQFIVFLNADTGWACGTGGVVIKTTNGGANWVSQTFTGVKFNSMDFIDANTGFVCGNNGIIWKTTNGGSDWVNQPSGVSQTLYQIKFTNSITGFAVGEDAIILKTVTGGNSWDLKNGPELFSQIFYSIGYEKLQPNLIFATGTLTKYSEDWGESWYLRDFSVEPIYSLKNLELKNLGYEDRYLGVGGNGYIMKTETQGINRTQEQSPTVQNLNSISYPNNANYIWAVGANGIILKNIPNWFKQSSPTSNQLKEVYFTDANTGYTVGDVGTILKTTDSGRNWDTISAGVTHKLFSVYFTNLNTGYVVGESATILKTPNGGTNWNTLSSGTLSNTLTSVYFTDANNGYCVGGFGTILKTTNGGTSWNEVSFGPTNHLSSVYFTDANTGYSVGKNGIILKTSDSGTSWNTLFSGTTHWLTSVYFLNANTGYTVGDSGTILKTTNSGTSWEKLSSGITGNLSSVYFIDEYLGYVCTYNNIYKTCDGGSNWFVEGLPPTGNLSDIKFIFENNTIVGFAVGDEILRTSFDYYGAEPDGNSGSYPGWVPVNSGTTDGFITRIDYINPFVAFGVGGPNDGGTEAAMILRTINGGQTWTRQQSNVTTSYLYDVSFADVNNGIAVGGFFSGLIRKTTDGGANWTEQTSVPLYGLYSVDMLDINNAYACGFQGLLIHTSNGGTNWETQNTGLPGVSWNSVDYINPTTATAVGSSGKIIRTTNTGLNWEEQTGGRGLNLVGVRFIDIDHGIAISNEGPVLHTSNGGVDWVQTDSLNGYGSQISYIDSLNAFIVTQFGGVSWIYRSTDGGLSWTLQTTVNGSYMSVSFADANNALISGSAGMILRTSNGGVSSGINTAYKSGGLNIPINDFESAIDSINVTITHKASQKDVVARLYLTIDSLFHTNDGDLEFYLEHNGITDTVIYRNGEGGENFLGTFLNDATNFPLVSGAAPFRGSFEPYRPLSKFNGQDAEGYWKLRIYDRAAGNTGTLQAWSLSIVPRLVEGTTDVTKIPKQNLFSRNYPNPFNTNTTIEFGLPNASFVTLKIYNIRGQEVETLINAKCHAGLNSVQWNAAETAGGVYFYRLQVGNVVETKKLFLMK